MNFGRLTYTVHTPAPQSIPATPYSICIDSVGSFIIDKQLPKLYIDISHQGSISRNNVYSYSIWMENCFSVTPVWDTISLQNSAHATTAQLPCHVRNFIAITLIHLGWEKNDISIEFELRWKHLSWNGPQIWNGFAWTEPETVIALSWIIVYVHQCLPSWICCCDLCAKEFAELLACDYMWLFSWQLYELYTTFIISTTCWFVNENIKALHSWSSVTGIQQWLLDSTHIMNVYLE